MFFDDEISPHEILKLNAVIIKMSLGILGT